MIRAARAAVTEGGALAAAIYDRSTRTLIGGHAESELPVEQLLDVLERAPRRSKLSALCGGEPLRAARELCVVGKQRTLFVSILDTGEVVVVATREAMSVALGWTLVRSLISALEGRG